MNINKLFVVSFMFLLILSITGCCNGLSEDKCDVKEDCKWEGCDSGAKSGVTCTTQCVDDPDGCCILKHPVLQETVCSNTKESGCKDAIGYVKQGWTKGSCESQKNVCGLVGACHITYSDGKTECKEMKARTCTGLAVTGQAKSVSFGGAGTKC